MSVARGNIRTVITVDGEQEFKRKMSNLRTQQQLLRSEAKALSSTYDENTTATQKLADKQDYLRKQIEREKAVINNLDEQIEKLSSRENLNEQEINKLSNQYNNAISRLNGFEKELADVDKALKTNAENLKKRGKAVQEFGDTVQNAGSKIESAGKQMSVLSGAAVGAMYMATDAAIDYESAFTGVKKTVDATEEEYRQLYDAILDLSEQIPATAEDIASVAEQAGQLGIAKENILDFTEVMINLGESTNIVANDAAEKLAKFANVTGMDPKYYENLGSVIVDLGNNFATTESDIVNMATRLASTGAIVGLSEPQIMALAAALSSVGIDAEAGGTAASKALKMISVAAENNKPILKTYASVANMTVEDFKALAKTDTLAALDAFTQGLKDTERNGKSANVILEEMDIKEVRLSNALLALSKSNGILTKTTKTANEAWEENTALSVEVEKRYGTLKSKLEIVKNTMRRVLIEFGEELMPYIEDGADIVKELAHRFSELDDEQKKNVLRMAAIVAAAGPLIITTGKLTSGVGTLIHTGGKLIETIAKLKTGEAVFAFQKLYRAFQTTSEAGTAVVGGAGAITSTLASSGPFILAILGATAAIGGMVLAYKSVVEGTGETKDTINSFGDSIDNFNDKLEDAEGSLESVKKSMNFDDKDAKLQSQFDEIQSKINKIAEKASSQRRKLTENEKEELISLFNELNKVTEKEIKLFGKAQSTLGSMIESEAKLSTEQATEYFKKTENLYSETKDKIISYYEEEYASIVQNNALSEVEKKKQIKKLQEWRDKELEIARKNREDNEEIISQKLIDEEEGYNNLLIEFDKYNKSIQELEDRYNDIRIASAGENWGVQLGNEISYLRERKQINEDFVAELKNLNEEEIGNYIAFAYEMIKNGDELTDKQKAMIYELIKAYETLPKGTSKPWKETIDNIIELIGDENFYQEGEKLSKDFLRGIDKGLKNSPWTKEITKSSKAVSDNVFETVKGGLQIKSPSKKAIWLMDMFNQGIVVGNEKNSPKVKKSSEVIANEIVSGFQNGLESKKVLMQYSSALADTAAMHSLYSSNVINNYSNNNQSHVINNTNIASDSNAGVLNDIYNLLLQSTANQGRSNITERDVSIALERIFKRNGIKLRG